MGRHTSQNLPGSCIFAGIMLLLFSSLIVLLLFKEIDSHPSDGHSADLLRYPRQVSGTNYEESFKKMLQSIQKVPFIKLLGEELFGASKPEKDLPDPISQDPKNPEPLRSIEQKQPLEGSSTVDSPRADSKGKQKELTSIPKIKSQILDTKPKQKIANQRIIPKSGNQILDSKSSQEQPVSSPIQSLENTIDTDSKSKPTGNEDAISAGREETPRSNQPPSPRSYIPETKNQMLDSKSRQKKPASELDNALENEIPDSKSEYTKATKIQEITGDSRDKISASMPQLNRPDSSHYNIPNKTDSLQEILEGLEFMSTFSNSLIMKILSGKMTISGVESKL